MFNSVRMSRLALTTEISLWYFPPSRGAPRFPEGTRQMTKADLVEAVSLQTRMTKKAAMELIDVVFDNIGKAVKKDARFSYPGFGTWSIRTRKARKIRNPQTNEIMKLKATKTIGFRPAKELKSTL